jgi:zinc/manganese transport system ATP-binding protein
VVHRWHQQQRTVIAVLHDLDQVRQHFDQTLLLARRCVAWGPTAQVLDARNLFKARQMAEAWDESAPSCTVEGDDLLAADGLAQGHDHAHPHAQPHLHLHGHAHAHGPAHAHTHTPAPDPAHAKGPAAA